MKFLIKKINMSRSQLALALMMVAGFLVPSLAAAGTLGVNAGVGGIEFKPFFDFIIAAGTGYLGRSIAIAGGIMGLGIGAATGKGLPALIGVFLAIFGVLGPTIINALFTSAIV